MTAQERINRGEASKRLMEDESLVDAFSSLEQGYADAWKSSLQHDTDGRERLYRKFLVLRELRDELKKQITDGAITLTRVK